MYYGMTQSGKKIHIGSSSGKEKYFCPVCNGILVRKRGTKIAHHFAHKSDACDSWDHAGKSIWHKEMQDYFPEKYQEVCMTDKQGEKHIADIFIRRTNGPNIIFEFQHSPISRQEFDRRNNFYTYAEANTDRLGNIVRNWVIWVFDMREKNMFIRLSNDNRTFPSVQTDTDPQCAQLLRAHQKEHCTKTFAKCQKFLCNDRGYLSYKKDLYINPNIRPAKGLYAQIHWKRPNNIFKNINNNIFIFFDVVQRRYAYMQDTYTDDYGNCHDQELYIFLGNGLTNSDGIDRMYRFFINVSSAFYGKHAYYLHYGDSDYKGTCYPIDSFWERVNTFIEKKNA